MLDRSLTLRYSKALYAAASDMNNVSEVLDELGTVQQSIESNKKLSAIFMHPAIPVSEKKQLAQELWGPYISETSMTFLYILFDASRINYLAGIFKDLSVLSSSSQNIREAHIATVYPMPPDMLQKFKDRLSTILHQDIDLSADVDRTILGGIKLTIGDTIIDGSVTYKLKKLEERILNS